MKGLRFTPQAAEEYVAALRWHEAQRTGRGQAFKASVKAAVTHLRKSPQAHPVVALEFRRVVVRRFPYALFYRVEADQVVVHAVFHTSQNPTKLAGRIGNA